MKDKIRDKWGEISTNSIRNKALRQWKMRLEAVVKEDGGRIEHLFYVIIIFFRLKKKKPNILHSYFCVTFGMCDDY